MKTYNVHIYREMRLFFPGIVATTAEEAATLAADLPSGAAKALEDCDGENLAALVGVIGREDCKQNWALIMASATPFCFCTTQKYLAVKRVRSSMT